MIKLLKKNLYDTIVISGNKSLEVDVKNNYAFLSFYGPIIKEINEELLLIKIDFIKDPSITYSYKSYLEEYKEDIKLNLEFNFNKDTIEIICDSDAQNEGKKKTILDNAKKIEQITKVTLLNGFNGEIISFVTSNSSSMETTSYYNIQEKLATNFLNYQAKYPNIYDYFNGLKPFIPFPLLIKGLFENKNIGSRARVSKNIFLKQFVKKIFDVLVKFCDEVNNKIIESEKQSVKKIANFIIRLFFEIDFSLLPEINLDDLKKPILKITGNTEKILCKFFSTFGLNCLKEILFLFYEEKNEKKKMRKKKRERKKKERKRGERK